MPLPVSAREVQPLPAVHGTVVGPRGRPLFRQLPEPGLLNEVQKRPPLTLAPWPSARVRVVAGEPPGGQEPAPAASPIQADGEGAAKLVGVNELEPRLSTFGQLQRHPRNCLKPPNLLFYERFSQRDAAPADVGVGGKRFSFQLADLEAAQAHDVRLDVVEEDGGWRIDSLEAD
jgi:hypothetical protein